MKSRHTALEYATLLSEYLEKLGLMTAFDICPEYPKWAGSISIAPGKIYCHDLDLPTDMNVSPRLDFDDDGWIRIYYAVPVRPGADSPDDDDFRILRILNDSPYNIKLHRHSECTIVRFNTTCSMNACTRAAAKGAAFFIRELLFSICVEMAHVIPKAYLEPDIRMETADWLERPFSVRRAEDIEPYIAAAIEDMDLAKTAAERHITEWDPKWGDPIEVMLRSDEEYKRTGHLSALIMHEAAADYILGQLLKSAKTKK